VRCEGRPQKSAKQDVRKDALGGSKRGNSSRGAGEGGTVVCIKRLCQRGALFIREPQERKVREKGVMNARKEKSREKLSQQGYPCNERLNTKGVARRRSK